MKLFLSKGLQRVMIRGIPKEGWKLAYRSLSASFIAISVGQKSLNGDVTHQLGIRMRLFLFFGVFIKLFL